MTSQPERGAYDIGDVTDYVVAHGDPIILVLTASDGYASMRITPDVAFDMAQSLITAADEFTD